MLAGYKQVKWKRYFTMEADIYYLPESQNQPGVDPLPQFFLRPTKLTGVQKISYNPSSVNNGYSKSLAGPFYLKNLDDPDVNLIEAHFQQFKNRPPYWFSTQDEYAEFVKQTFNTSYVSRVRDLYYETEEAVKFYKASSDPVIGVDHFKSKTVIRSVEEFAVKKVFNMATANNLEIITA